MISVLDLKVGDILEDINHHRYFIIEIKRGGDVLARDNQNRMWYIERIELRNYTKVTR